MKFVENLFAWFADLEARERLIIILGAAVLTIAAFYMALLPSIEKNIELKSRYEVLAEDMQWLRDQAQLVKRMDMRCPLEVLMADDKKELINRIARRSQMKVSGLVEDSPGLFSLKVRDINANRILQFAHQLACQGLALETLSISAASKKEAALLADIEVRNVN